MSLGSWVVDVTVGSMPEKVATAVSALSEQLVGAEYTPLAYLGSQVVNGINHAVLAEQLLTTGKDTKNVVVLIFNEKGMDCNLVSIERVLESGVEFGGIAANPTVNIPDDINKEFDKAIEGLVGVSIKPFAYLGCQVTKGVNYFFAAEVAPVVPDPKTKVAIVITNTLTGELSMTDLLNTKTDALSLGYAFTWLKRQNTSLGGPLGEWP